MEKIFESINKIESSEVAHEEELEKLKIENEKLKIENKKLIGEAILKERKRIGLIIKDKLGDSVEQDYQKICTLLDTLPGFPSMGGGANVKYPFFRQVVSPRSSDKLMGC